MASNYFSSGSGEKTVTFPRPVNYVNVFVASGVTFSFSIDTINYLTLPAGFHSFPVGSVLEMRIMASGDWQLIGVQS